MTKLRQFLLLNHDQMQPQIGILHNQIHLNRTLLNQEMFEEMMSIMEKVLSNTSRNKKDPRFSLAHYPSVLEKDSPKEKVTVWCGLMAKEVFQHAFSLFAKGDLDEDEVKCLASSSFLRNLMKLAENGTDLGESIKEIDSKLRDNILPYLKGKYPQSKSKQINLKLNEAAKEINDLENNKNDLLFKSGIKFELSQQKEYDSSIMKFLNYIISVPNSKFQDPNSKFQDPNSKFQDPNSKFQDKNKKTIYEDFSQYFTNLFEKAYSKQEIAKMQKESEKKESQKEKEQQKQNLIMEEEIYIEESQKQREQYKQKVKEYTKFFINRKISPNLPIFSDEEIKEGNLRLKNSALMRVVTKWCEELRKIFKDPHSTAHKHGQFRMVDGSQGYLSHNQANALEILLESKNDEIKNWLEKVQEHNFKTQEEFSKKKITDPDLEMLSEEESSVGMFAAINDRNYQFYLISYLKELIHHCLQVMDDFQCLCYSSLQWEYKQISKDNVKKQIIEGEKKRKDQDRPTTKSRVVNLMSFKIGDLLRCKCSSKEKQINALYHYVDRESRKDPKTLKIVKIKNRLEKGTKDILLNLLFKEKILIEVQLAIDAGKNQFIECSDKFNHYIYEIERAQFGPISELCNIWMSKDPRANFFRQHFQEKHRPNFPLHYFPEKQQNNQSAFPFLCKCDRYGINPLRVENDDKQCLHCVLDKHTKYPEIKQISETFKKLPDIKKQSDNEVKRIKYKKGFQFPDSGLVMNLKNKEKVYKYFRCFQREKQKFLMIQEKDDKFRKIGQITKKQQQQLFLQNNIVFDHPQFGEKANQVEEEEVVKRYFIPKIFESIKNQQKGSVKIINDGLTDELLGEEVYDFVQSVNLSENRLKIINKVIHKFPKVEKLILTSNQFDEISIQENLVNLRQFHLNSANIQDFSKIILSNIKSIEILTLASNKIKELPKQIGKLSQLKTLNLYDNKLTEIPSSFDKLVSLQQLYLSNNQLTQVPSSFDKLVSLQKLYLNNNQLTQVPSSFDKLVSLQQLYLGNNQLTQVPSSIDKLISLQILALNNNQLTQVPSSFDKLVSLQILVLGDNQLTQVPSSFDKLVSLQKLWLNKNQLTQVPSSIDKLISLQILALNNNQLTQVPSSFDKLVSLQILALNNNQLTQVPSSFDKLVSLQILVLGDNQLTQVPSSFDKLVSLQQLYLSNNQLTQVPSSFDKLVSLQYLYLSNNQLTQVPSSFDKLVSLQKLWLNKNQLTQIPSSFCKLENLTLLALQKNRLSSIPDSIGEMKNLETLYIEDNILVQLPDFVMDLPKLKRLDLSMEQLNEKSKQIIQKLKIRGVKVYDS